MGTKKISQPDQATSKAPASQPCSLEPPPSEEAEANVDWNLRIANAFKSVIVTTRNEEFREKCLTILGVKNGSEAGKKVEALLAEFKDSQKAKWCH